MSDMVMTVCSALAALCGVALLVQGMRAGLATKTGRRRFREGIVLVLVIGSNLLPPNLNALRDALVVVGCLVVLAAMLWPGREPATDDGG